MPGACAVSDREKVVLSWSGGKDSTMALYELRRSARYEVVALLTTVAGEFDRVSHHGVRVEPLEQQAAAVAVALLRDLPAEVDPCGENGEFHSFVYDGPIFRRPVPVTVGEVVARDIRYFADLLPGDRPGAD